MKCTNKEQETCEFEKRGCIGCAYYEDGSDTNVGSIEKKNIEDKEIEDLNDFADLLRPEQRYYTNIIKKVIEDRLKDREKIKELENSLNKMSDEFLINDKLVNKLKEGSTFTFNQMKFIYKNFIKKQTIKDKIEKIFNVKIHNYNYLADTDWNYSQEQMDRQIASLLQIVLNEVLDELLQENENKNMNLKGAIKNLKEIVELVEEEINNNDVNVTAILDLKDLKSLQVVINKLESEE